MGPLLFWSILILIYELFKDTMDGIISGASMAVGKDVFIIFCSIIGIFISFIFVHLFVRLKKVL
jgi:tetrahydromethanopterin S-methyltransferase subunit G